jgi:hypothetical protein
MATLERVGHNGMHFTAQMMQDAAPASVTGEFAKVVSAATLFEAL